MSSVRLGRVAALAVALVPALLLAPTGSGSASADATSVPGVLTTSSTPSQPGTADTLGSAGAISGPTLTLSAGPIAVPVPSGVVPSEITGVLTMPSAPAGATVVLLVNGRESLSLPATLYSRIRVPVTPADVVADGTIGLSVRYDAPAGSTSCSPAPGITVRRLGLEYTGTEEPPTTVSTFFPAAVSRIDVRVAPDAGDDVLQAALTAVAALSHRYQGDTPIVLDSDDEPLPAAGAGQRVVSVVGAGGDVAAEVGAVGDVPALTISGSGLPLTAAARGLGGDELVLADGQQTEGLTRQVESRDDGLTRTVDQLRSDLATPTGVTQPDPRGTVSLELRQDAFGSTLDGYRVHLEGTHTAVPADAEARLDVYVDDELVGSQLLGDGTAIDLDADVPPGLVRPTNQLRATIVSSDEPASLCAPGLPLDLFVDGEASTVTASRGNGVARGFALLPQAFGGRLRVALRQDGPPRIDDAQDAGALISAMQRAGATPYDISIVDPDLFVSGDDSGMIVGADTEDALALATPLQLSGDRSLDVSDTAFTVATGEPFAALEAVARRGRYVLMLGSWQPGGLQADPALSHRLTTKVANEGWGSIDGDVVVSDGSGEPYTVDSGTPASEPAGEGDDDGGGTSYVGWFAVGIALLLALLAVQLVRALRRDRRARDAALAPSLDPEPEGPSPSEEAPAGGISPEPQPRP